MSEARQILTRQEQIYYEAARLFNAKGFAATSMNDIAAAVGVTKPGLYHFVKGKEDLFNTIQRFAMDLFEKEVVEPSRAVADPRERLKTMIRCHVENIGSAQIDSGNPLTIIVSETAGLSEENLSFINSRKRAYFDLIRSTLTELRNSGDLAEEIDITVAAFCIPAMVLQMPNWHRLGGRLSLEQVADTIIQMALGGALKPESARQPSTMVA